jgi:hypothetical protein
MLKANEVRIRSLDKENGQLKEKVKNLSGRNQKLEKGIFKLVCDFKQYGGHKDELIDLVEGIDELMDLNEIYDEGEESLNTEEELKVNIKEVEDDEDDNKSVNSQNKDTMGLDEQAKRKEKEGRGRRSVGSLGISNTLTMGKSKRKPGLSPQQRLKEKSEFQIKLEEEIDKNIQNRSKLKKERTSICKDMPIDIQKIDVSNNNLSRHSSKINKSYEFGEVEDKKKEQFFLKCKVLDPEIFEENEKEQLEFRIKSIKNLESFTLWLWNYFEDKVKLFVSNNKKLEYEKSKFIKQQIF